MSRAASVGAVANADLLLHPVRLRILKLFLGERALTTSQLAEELGDVPTGSLYRHVAILTKAGVLQVVAERQVHGIVERTYTLRSAAARIGASQAAAMSNEEHARAFTAYVAGLLADVDRYLAAGPDLLREGFSYQTAAMWVTDDEYRDFLRDVQIAVQPRLANGPAKGRKRRMVFSVFLPAPEEKTGGPPRRRSKRKAPEHED
jgi:DNA-binding transcriptional ArsR family regulator